MLVVRPKKDSCVKLDPAFKDTSMDIACWFLQHERLTPTCFSDFNWTSARTPTRPNECVAVCMESAQYVCVCRASFLLDKTNHAARYHRNVSLCASGWLIRKGSLMVVAEWSDCDLNWKALRDLNSRKHHLFLDPKTLQLWPCRRLSLSLCVIQ